MEASSSAVPNSTPDFETLSKHLLKFDGVIYLLISLLGIAGNTMVFIAFAISKKLQTKTNIFVVNLAFADFVTSLLLPIFAWSLISDIYVIHPWIDVICALAMGFAQVSVGCSLITLAFIALNRLILITRNRKTYVRIFRTRNCVFFLVIAWLAPMVADVTPLLFGIGELGFDQHAHICGAKSNNPYSYTYDVIIVGSYIPIPMLIIVYSYARIFRYIAIHNKKLSASQSISSDLQAR
ncbi:G-protein coupled receptor moody [Holothuria leucospilota]|uniref:G-protein coupled receptor moody n=1 Tax=Holothuria leucospilota TaxID=206669 RepID=A0A9Q0YM09_HOLLE|nr:G-protein coupled receptor moody [Holothuria leucospilota]